MEGNSQSLQSAVLHPNLHESPPKIVHAQGHYLTLDNGRKIFDATGGPAVACIGHGNSDVQHAVAIQMQQLSYCHSLYWTNTGAEDLAKILIDSTAGVMARASMVSSGSEAMEAAMKLARQYFLELSPPEPERYRFIARKGSFHGTTIATLALTARTAVKKQFLPLLNDNVTHVSACNPYRDLRKDESIEDYVLRLANELEDEFKRLGPRTVCAFVAETMAGTSLGCVAAVPGYFPAVKAVCEKYGALLILDEVICGMGRTGTYHAWQQENVFPDIQIVAKGLGGGFLPIAAVLSNHKVVNALDGGSGFFNHGHTYQSHAVACAAAAEVQNIIKRDCLVYNAANMGERLGQSLKAALLNHPNVGDIRGRGLFWAIEFVKDKTSQEPFSLSEGVAMRIRNKGIQEPYNISLWPVSGGVDGLGGDHIMISPAYDVTAEEIDMISTLTTRVVLEVLGDMIGGVSTAKTYENFSNRYLVAKQPPLEPTRLISVQQ